MLFQALAQAVTTGPAKAVVEAFSTLPGSVDEAVGWLEKIKELMAVYGLRIIGAGAILIIGRLVAKLVRSIVGRLMTRARADATLVSFVQALTYTALMAFVIIAALGQLGVQTASFVAVLGAAGLAVGLALQGSLANFAAGVLLLVFRPFRADDLIEAGGSMGVVTEIGIFTTTLRTPDRRRVVVPNSKVTGNNIIIHYTAEGIRRVDLVVSVSYSADLKKARRAPVPSRGGELIAQSA
jgi:small conductance mechanosensitive channel